MFKQKNIMIIGITFLKDNKINVSYLLRQELNLSQYRGLIPLEFKTELTKQFADFTNFGKWIGGEIDDNGCIVDLY